MDEGRRDHGAQQNRIMRERDRESGRRRRTCEAGARRMASDKTLFVCLRKMIRFLQRDLVFLDRLFSPKQTTDELKTSIPVVDLFILITECWFSLHGPVASDFASPPSSSPLHGLPTHSTQVGRLSSGRSCNFPQERH